MTPQERLVKIFIDNGLNSCHTGREIDLLSKAIIDAGFIHKSDLVCDEEKLKNIISNECLTKEGYFQFIPAKISTTIKAHSKEIWRIRE